MNTEIFCVELEKFFGQYKSKCKKTCQRILSGSKTMTSSPYSNFVYQVSLHLKVYKRFRRRFRKSCRKSELATYVFIYLFHLIIYLKLTNLQKYSTHIYIKVARQIGKLAN